MELLAMEESRWKWEQRVTNILLFMVAVAAIFSCIVQRSSALDGVSDRCEQALLFILLYLAIFQRKRLWELIEPRESDLNRCVNGKTILILATVMLFLATFIYVTGGAKSNFKLLFLPVILIYSLNYGLLVGQIASGLAALVILTFFIAGQYKACWNTHLEGDLFLIVVLYSVNWVVAKFHESLRQSFSLVRQLERLAELGEIAAATAHEIRNPLATIRGLLQLLQIRHEGFSGDLSKKDKEYFDVMLSEVDRINNIISDILLFGRPSPPNLKLMDLNLLLKEADILLQGLSRLQGIEIKLRTVEEPQMIYLDGKQMKQVLYNLAINAFEAMPCGGKLAISVIPGETVVQLRFTDTGMGIPREYLDKLFEPFFTAGEKGGTGLGLAISHRIITGHNGTIDVESNLAEGTTFTITLPRPKGLVAE
jgi:signal transduction histidine kinase